MATTLLASNAVEECRFIIEGFIHIFIFSHVLPFYILYFYFSTEGWFVVSVSRSVRKPSPVYLRLPWFYLLLITPTQTVEISSSSLVFYFLDMNHKLKWISFLSGLFLDYFKNYYFKNLYSLFPRSKKLIHFYLWLISNKTGWSWSFGEGVPAFQLFRGLFFISLHVSPSWYDRIQRNEVRRSVSVLNQRKRAMRISNVWIFNLVLW